MESSRLNPKITRLRRDLRRAEEEAKRKNYAEALHVFARLAEDFSDVPEVFWKRSFVHEWMHNLDSAIADLNRCLELEPNDVSVYFSRGVLWIRAENPERGIEDLSRVIESGCSYFLEAAYFCRAVAYLRQKKFDKALADSMNTSEDSILADIEKYEWKTKDDLIRAAKAGLRHQSGNLSKDSRDKP